MREFIQVDVFQVARRLLPMRTCSLVSGGWQPSTGGSGIRREGLYGEAGLGARVNMGAKLHGKRMCLDGIAVVMSRTVVVEAVQEVIEVNGLYFLFLFLSVHH